jgi:RHS repeat-associated protein
MVLLEKYLPTQRCWVVLQNRTLSTFFVLIAFSLSGSLFAAVNKDGSFGYSIPINTPEARAGLDLKLSLNYNSNAGTSVAGKGWVLSGIPAVQTDTAYPVNHDDNDHYIGRSGRLIRQASGIYMHQVADFTSYEKYGNCGGAPCGFIETLTNNTKLYYGNSDISQPVCNAGCHDGGTGKVNTWYLVKMQDVHGNYLTIEYADDLGEKYPVKIRYNRHENLSHEKEIAFAYDYRSDYWKRWFLGDSAEMRKRLSAILVYGDSYYAGDIPLYKKLTHWYELVYTEKPDNTSILSSLKFYDSANNEVTEAGISFTYDTGEMQVQRENEIPANRNFPLGFSDPTRRTFQGDFDGNGYADVLYTDGGNFHLSLNTKGEFSENYSPDVTQHANDYLYLTAGDFDADGISDLLLIRTDKILLLSFRNSQWISRSVYTTNGTSGIGWPYSKTSSSQFYAGDFNGDSKPDIAYYSDSTGIIVLPNKFHDGWGDWIFAQSPAQWSGVSVSLGFFPGDYNGDGKTDLLYQSSPYNLHVILSTGNSFSNSQLWYSESNGIPYNEQPYGRIMAGDFNGDGKSDLLMLKQNIIVMLSTGKSFSYSEWHNEDLISLSNAYTCCTPGRKFEDDNQTTDWSKFTIGDFNGDGKQDFAFLRLNSAIYGGLIAIGLSDGNKFNFTYHWQNFSVISETYNTNAWPQRRIGTDFIVIDMNSDTTDDLLLHTNLGSQKINVSVKRDLLTTIEKADGTKLQVQYKNLAEEERAFQGNLYGGTFFSRYPRKIVSTVSTFIPDLGNDNTSDTLYTDYTYSGAAVYAAGRVYGRNLGFLYIGEKDRRSGKLYNKLYHKGEFNSDMYYQDSVVHEGTSKIFSTGQYNGEVNITGIHCTENGCPRFENIFAEGIIYYYTKPTTMFRPYSLPSSKTSFDDANGQINTVGSQTRTEYMKTNRWGQYTHIRERHSGPGVERYINIHTNYINAFYPHRFVGLVSEKKVCLEDCSTENLLSHERYYYDNLPLGQVGSKGLLTRKEILSGEKLTYVNYQYDEYGNPTESVDTAGMARVIEYDNDFKQYATKTYVRGAYNLTGSVKLFSGFDSRWGVPTNVTDENGVTENNYLDNRGRILQKNILSGGTALRRITYEYSDQPGNRYKEECRKYGLFFMYKTCERTYRDGMGRVIRKVTPSVNGESEGFAGIRIEYDALGRKFKESRPYFTDKTGQSILSALQWTTIEYNDRDKPVKTIAPDGKITQATYSPDLISGGVSSLEITDARGLKTKTYTDINGQALRTTEAVGTPQQTQLDNIYNTKGQLVAVHSPAGNTTIEWSAINNQKSKIIDPNAGISRWTYFNTPGTPADNKPQYEYRYAPDTVMATENATEFSYDELGRLYKIQNPSATITYNYGIYPEEYNVGRIAGIQKKGENYVYTEKYKYSPLGEIIAVIRIHRGADWSNCEMQPVLPCYSVTAMEYDDLGRIQKVTQPDGQETVYEYYFATNKVKSISHDGNTYVQYKTYDIMGRSRHITYGNGLVSESDYDALTLMPRKITTHKDATALLDWEYTFDNAGNISNLTDNILPERTAVMTYDNLNRLQTLTRNGKTENYTFDSAGNLQVKSLVRNIYSGTRIISNEKRGSNDDPWQPHQSFGWSNSGNLLTRTATGDQPGFIYEYDDDYMMTKAVDSNSNETKFYYDHGGQRFLKIYEQQGYPGIYTYYINDYLEIRQKRSGSTFVAQQVSRTLRGAGGERIASISDSVQTLAYNTSGRYTLMAQATDGASISSQLQAGMFRYMSLYAKLEENKLGLYAALLVIFLFVFIYDNKPFLCGSKILLAPGFNPGIISRLTAVLLIGSILHMSNCSVTSSVSGSIPGLTTGEATATMGSLYDGLPAGTFYYTGDHLGSSSLITNANGDEVLRIAYDSYGSIDLTQSGRLENGSLTLATDQAEYGILAVRFTGQEYDPETGLYYYNARYYDPQLGIFTTADTYIPDANDSQSYNRHMYVRGNPILYNDPSGHFFKSFMQYLGNLVAAVFSPTIAVYSAVTKTNFRDNFIKTADFMASYGIPAMAGAAASAITGGLLGPLLGGGASLAGAIGTGAAAGAAGGFVTGFTSGLTNDLPFEKAFFRGLRAMGAGAVGGAFLGGVLYGLNEAWHLSQFGDGFSYRDLPCLGSCSSLGVADVAPVVSDVASPLYEPLIPPWLLSTIPGAAGVAGGLYAQVYPPKGPIIQDGIRQWQDFQDGWYNRAKAGQACTESGSCIDTYTPWRKGIPESEIQKEAPGWLKDDYFEKFKRFPKPAKGGIRGSFLNLRYRPLKRM